MSFLTELTVAKTTPTIQFNIFLVQYKPGIQTIFAFWEGRDDPSFYRMRIAEALPTGYNLETFACGTKRAVLEAFDQFTQRHREDPRVLFFVDKDHSDFATEGFTTPTAQTIFVTSTYSIENYIVCAHTVRLTCIELLAINSSDPLLAQIVADFQSALSEFQRVIRPLMAFIIYARAKGCHPQLNNLDLKKLIALNAACFPRATYDVDTDWTTLCTSLNIVLPKPSTRTNQRWRARLRLADAKRWLRGKAEMWFLVRFVLTVADAVGKAGRGKLRTQISASNAVEVLASRSPYPAELEAFLARTIGSLP